MTDKHDEKDTLEPPERKRLVFLIWAGVMAPLAFSVILGLLEASNIHNIAQVVALLFA